MSLNKFFDVNTGLDINMNIGADIIKCNTLETNNINGKTPLVYEPPKDPTAPTNINEGAICIFQNTDDPSNVSKTNYIKIETYTTGGGGQLIDMANSPLINALNITNSVIDSSITLSTILEGSTTENILADRRSHMGSYIYSPRATIPLIPTQINCNAIRLSDEQVARDTTYFYKFVVDNCGLVVQGGAVVSPPSYPFSDSFGVSPNLNECIEVVYVFRKATLSWVRCKQIT